MLEHKNERIHSLNDIMWIIKSTFTTIVIKTENFIILFSNIIVGFIQFWKIYFNYLKKCVFK